MAFELPVVDPASLAAWCELHLGSPAAGELFRDGHLARVIGARLADGREIVALAFVVRRDHPQYAGRLPVAKQVDVLAHARGAFGASADYLERTRVALISHGIVDPYLEELARRLVSASKRD